MRRVLLAVALVALAGSALAQQLDPKALLLQHWSQFAGATSVAIGNAQSLEAARDAFQADLKRLLDESARQAAELACWQKTGKACEAPEKPAP